MKTQVLDHGFVRLVDSMGGDLSVARSARVSYDAAWRAGEDEGSDAKLIRYLWKHKHTTPFEAVTFTFEVKAPIFVFRQWHRHRTQSYNELSARYKELPEEFYIPEARVIGEQSKKSKQGRALLDDVELDEARMFCIENERNLLLNTCTEAFQVYRELLESGWSRELARTVLPLSTYSVMFATMNLLNLLRFLTLRCASDAQHEIRVYAYAMKHMAQSVAPVCLEAWEGSNG